MTTSAFFRTMGSCAACTLVLVACNGQVTHPNGKAGNHDSTAQPADTPHVEVKVNKQFDEHGNLIAFDSSYTSVYSRGLGNTAFMDSLFMDFRPKMGQRYPFLNDPGFDNLFFNDSLLYRDFFQDDFFKNRMLLNQQYMDRMMHDMDSLKNRYFQRAQPPPKGSGTL